MYITTYMYCLVVLSRLLCSRLYPVPHVRLSSLKNVYLLTYVLCCRRNQFENTLLVQSWRITFDDIELVNSKGKHKDASVSTISRAGFRLHRMHEMQTIVTGVRGVCLLVCHVAQLGFAVLKRLNGSRCCLGRTLLGAQNIVSDWGPDISTAMGWESSGKLCSMWIPTTYLRNGRSYRLQRVQWVLYIRCSLCQITLASCYISWRLVKQLLFPVFLSRPQLPVCVSMSVH